MWSDLHLLDRNWTELENKDSSSIRCETAEDQALGSDKKWMEWRTEIQELMRAWAPTKNVTGEGTQAVDGVSAGWDVDRRVWKVDKKQCEDENMGHRFLPGQVWMNGDQVNQIDDKENWWGRGGGSHKNRML